MVITPWCGPRCFAPSLERTKIARIFYTSKLFWAWILRKKNILMGAKRNHGLLAHGSEPAVFGCLLLRPAHPLGKLAFHRKLVSSPPPSLVIAELTADNSKGVTPLLLVSRLRLQ